MPMVLKHSRRILLGMFYNGSHHNEFINLSTLCIPFTPHLWTLSISEELYLACCPVVVYFRMSFYNYFLTDGLPQISTPTLSWHRGHRMIGSTQIAIRVLWSVAKGSSRHIRQPLLLEVSYVIGDVDNTSRPPQWRILSI
ncbi:hypothetical protein AVEN_47576-1 [Araneus ventricosus]|uniref:Uncharacterized protein n=1 Tax=Araneus ventricosus TaxID=182803 RepID=A0A4Y2DLT7_ARAVE|nr:hypothetical protein AVEN_47576-1 [Araneus ventricosus]